MSTEYIKVGMADLKVATAPMVLTTLGLGSCVGIALYDSVKKLGGLAHIMLPDSSQIKNNQNLAKFADTGLKELLEKIEKEGGNRHRLVAKIAGGAQMFNFPNTEDSMRIGVRNTLAVKALLENYKIPLIAEETGENYGRTIELHTETGKLVVKTIGHGIKEV